MKIMIEGRPVEVGDDWGQLSGEDKNRRVEEVAKKQMIVSPTAPDQYRGAILPISKDAAGNTRFDITAGLPATIVKGVYDAFRLPGDVAVGDQQVIDPATGRPSSQLMERAANFGQSVNLTSPATIAGRASMMQAPSAQVLKDTADTGFYATRATGMQVGGSAIRDLVDDLWRQYKGRGLIAPEAPLAPKTNAMVGGMRQTPVYGQNMPIGDLMAHRQTLLGVATGADKQEAMAASIAIRKIDEMLEGLTPAQTVGGTHTAQEVADLYRTANANWAASQRANAITGDLTDATRGIVERAQGRASATYSGRNFDNAVRQRMAAFLEDEHNLFGFSPAEIKMMERVRDGTAPQNMVRSFANLLGGGGGMGQAVTAGGVGTLASGAALSSGVAAPVAAGVGTTAAVTTGVLGRAMKALENLMASRGVRQLDEAIRLRSPEGARRLANQPDQWSARDTAILRAVTPPGLLETLSKGDQPPPQGGYVTSDDPAWSRRLPPGFI